MGNGGVRAAGRGGEGEGRGVVTVVEDSVEGHRAKGGAAVGGEGHGDGFYDAAYADGMASGKQGGEAGEEEDDEGCWGHEHGG